MEGFITLQAGSDVLPVVLAYDLNLRDGFALVVVPSVITASDYSLVREYP